MSKTYLIESRDYFVGRLHLIASERGLSFVTLAENELPQSVQQKFSNPKKAWLPSIYWQALDAALNGNALPPFPADISGTAFQQRVWQALARIPFGETTTYGALAETIGAPKAMRAVGSACGKNPLAIIWPCHRVVGKNGKLTGFALGLEVKEKLLAHERASISTACRPDLNSSLKAA